jgi:hypothetical protein
MYVILGGPTLLLLLQLLLLSLINILSNTLPSDPPLVPSQICALYS